ncbi:TVP38/TMEM64 family protein [Mesorhizobium sp. NBSH29]|uniref:TVP38/TMEM64 family protein n=1 Tax=Mesorhizobium sp. NBSH29 TaxID=2654249 RepID=UPI0021563E46|nr:TVP38/TMEM64 family protein [Mesorhizobium sp. NBSH29]
MARRVLPTDQSTPTGNLWRIAPLFVVAAMLAFGYAMGWQRYLSLEYLAESQEMLRGYVAARPVLAPLGFIALYAVAVAASFPAASVLTVSAGFLFGWALGGAVAVIGATIGATLLFLAARTAFGGFLRRRLGGFSAKLADGFEKDAFSFLLVLRLAPFIPFFIANIAPALFNVRLSTFTLATAIGIIPGAVAYAFLGEGLGSVLAAAEGAGRDVGIKDLVTPEITIAFAALALVALIAAIVKKRWKGTGSA